MSETRASVKVTIPQGSRISPYSWVRQATGSFSEVHSQPKKPSRDGSGDGSATSTSSSPRARARSDRPISRAPRSPRASSGSPITVTERPTPRSTLTTA